MYNFTLAKPSVVFKHQFLSSNWRKGFFLPCKRWIWFRFASFRLVFLFMCIGRAEPFMNGLIYVPAKAAASSSRCQSLQCVQGAAVQSPSPCLLSWLQGESEQSSLSFISHHVFGPSAGQGLQSLARRRAAEKSWRWANNNNNNNPNVNLLLIIKNIKSII